MKKMIIMAVLFFLVSGCNLISRGYSVSAPEEDIHKGNQGLVMEFMQNTPPSQVYEDDIFPIIIKLDNKGAFDIKSGYMLLNLEEDNLELQRGSVKEILRVEGKSFGNIEGGTGTITYSVKAKELSSETETITSSIMATACYAYQTAFSENVCVDTDFHNLKNQAKACSAKDLSFSSGQGAPVSVVKVEQRMMEEGSMIKPSFTVYVKNEGDGEVISSDSIGDMCSARAISYEDINKIEVSAYLGGVELKCRPSPLNLQENGNKLGCYLEKGIGKDVPSYTSILTVILDYGYSETISKSTEIRAEI